MSHNAPVYIVEDEPALSALLVGLCSDRGLECRAFGDGEAFMAALGVLRPGCVLLDMRLPRLGGLDIQAQMKQLGCAFPVVGMTGHADVDMVVDSMRLGAVDFLEKPFDTDVLFAAIDRGLAMLEPAPRAGEGGNDPAGDGLND